MIEQQLSDINFEQLCVGRKFYESPHAWEDQVLYFFLPDRFSDGKEQNYKDIHGNIVTSGTTPMYTSADYENAIKPPHDPAQWREAGGKWVGGKIKGITSKLGYLKRMGVTAIWLGPIFKQVSFQNSYHGYGIQNFLDADPNFGTRDELKELVEEAHKNNIYVIMDIILNHTGDVFKYSTCHLHDGGKTCDSRWDGSTYDVEGFRAWKNEGGQDVEFAIEMGPIDLTQNPEAWPDGAVWPREFQNKDFYNRQGSISNWDYKPEYIQGDFSSLKDLNLQGDPDIEKYQPTEALKALCKVYKFWITYTNVDGFRIDTVKHVDPGAIRFFASSMHEFTQAIGKDNFYLIGEITGGRDNAFHTLEITGLDAALGIDEVQERLAKMVKGDWEPSLYFNLFRNSLLVDKESHTWFMDKVVTMVDDHDKVPQGNIKSRFCAFVDPAKVQELALNALAVNATTMGIPCIYYGTEQCFDGEGGNDRYIREAMFGGEFGAFRSRERHFFNENNFTYKELAKVLEIRRNNLTLLRGQQYLREISGNGIDFGYPQGFGGKIRSIVAWSRIFNENEVLVAFNTDIYNPITAWVIIDKSLHQPGENFICAYCSNDKTKQGEHLNVEAKRNTEIYALKLTLPACGFVIYQKSDSNGGCIVH
jgi:glycosidase